MKNTFEMTSWDEVPYLELEGGVKYSKASISKQYNGQMVGSGQLEYIMAYHKDGIATFVGIEHFSGSIDGKKGSATFSHYGTFENAVVMSDFTIVENSTKGDLVGLTGNGSFRTGHSMLVEFVLDVSF